MTELRQGVTPTQHKLLDLVNDHETDAVLAPADLGHLLAASNLLLQQATTAPVALDKYNRLIAAAAIALAAAERLAAYPLNLKGTPNG